MPNRDARDHTRAMAHSVDDLAAAASHPRLALRLLGRFVATVDGVELAAARWPALRAAHLVQLLALAPHHRLPRDRVIDALWPDLDPDAGAANLRKAAHHARHALGRHDAVVLRGGEVALWPNGALSVDVEAFDRTAQAALASRDSAACAAAAAAYGGELLPGHAYEPWTASTRDRLHACLLELLRLSGQWERLARLEPTDEPAHRELMVLELASGNRAAAIRWYARLRDALQQQLGVHPDRETEALYARCIAGLQQAGPAFVGRAWVRAQAAAWLSLPPRERPGGIVLRGAPGIGKSALARELEGQAQQRGWPVVRVQAALAGRTHAVVTALAERVLLADRSVLDRIGTPARSVLALLTPLAAAAPELQGPLGRHQVIGAIRRLLLAASAGRDAMLLIDDAQWIDDAEADVLMQLASAGPPLFLVLAMRTSSAVSALARGVARLAAAGSLRIIDLEPLPDDEVRRLVAQAAPAPLAPETLDRMVADAAGSPFAAIELARCTGLSGAGPLPRSVAEAITARLCDVPAAALAALKWLALAGDAFDAATAEALTPDAASHAFAVLDLALDAGVLVPTGAHYRFRHELVRQALIEPIPPHQRMKMHRQIAQRLAELDAAPAVVARHWQQGGNPREAAPWWVAAAREAMRLAAFGDALRHLEPVLAHERAHTEALRLRAEALDAMGDARAVAAYREAAQCAGEPLSHDLRAKGALAQIKQGDPKGALLALQGVRPSTAEGLLCEALAWSGAAALGAADPTLGTEKAAQARRLAMDTGDLAGIVVASWAHAAAAHARGDLHRSIWVDLHDTRQMPHLAVRVFDGQLCMAQRFLYGARPYAEVIAFARQLADEAQRIGAARGHAFGVTIEGEARLLAGDLDDAEQLLRQGVRLHQAIGAATGEAFALQRLAEVALYRGERERAVERLDEALDVARQSDVGFHLFDRIYGTRMLAAENPEAGLRALDEARAAVRGPLETCPGCRITFAVPAAITAARGGRLDLAEAYERQSAYLADVVMRLPAWRAAHDEVRGRIAAARGARDDASALFSAAAVRFRAAGHPLDAARCERLAASGSDEFNDGAGMGSRPG